MAGGGGGGRLAGWPAVSDRMPCGGLGGPAAELPSGAPTGRSLPRRAAALGVLRQSCPVLLSPPPHMTANRAREPALPGAAAAAACVHAARPAGQITLARFAAARSLPGRMDI